MNVEDFEFALAPDLIAQRPAKRRELSRLLVLDRVTGAVRHRTFADLPELLRAGDLLVLNDTRVVPARLVGRKATGGRVELLLVEQLEATDEFTTWNCLIKASRRPEPGGRIDFEQGLRAKVLELDDRGCRVRLEARQGKLDELLDRVGRMPLPPYIRRSDDDRDTLDRERYQTVYAKSPGAIAAPTAGLHFTEELLRDLRKREIETACLTLHVGLGTFLPVTARRVEEHRIHRERFEITQQVAESVDATRRRGGRVVAVGTTVVRALESCATGDRLVSPTRGDCGLFIYPGFGFKVVDALVTNFHLPRSTLLMLVCAFAGRERVLTAYREAIRMGYRFYSYGDAMLLESSA